MKRFLVLIFGFCFLFLPQFVFADDSWLIENFHSDIAMQDSGKVRVVETISVDFRNQEKHGIYRDIPYLYESNGKQTYTDVSINNVLLDNVPVPYTTSQTNGYKELKIGDPNELITGRNLYTITYTVTGVLRGFNDYDEFYWNVTGNNWEVPIQKADAIVTLPENGLSQITCYEGLSGSQRPCLSKQESLQLASFSTTTKLAPSEGLTIVVGYKKGLIPLVTAQPPKTFLQQFVTWQSLLTIGGVFLLGVIVIIYVWYRNGRDFWLAGQLFGTKGDTGKAKPVGAHETVSVEFTPPENLRPAELGVLMDERADTLDVVATMIDLASRGYLTITEVPKKWLFGKVDYLLVKTTPKVNRKSVVLVPYEQLLLDKLFSKRSQIKASSLKQTFYEDLQEVKQALYDDVVAKGFFPEDPEKIRSKYQSVGIGLFIVSILGIFFSIAHEIVPLADLSIGVLLSGTILLIESRFMPRKTAYGRELLRRSKGYYLFINTAEKYRQRFFEKKNMFNEVLPYAIMFGLTEKFAKQMHDIGIEPKSLGWYNSSSAFNTGLFVGSMNNFSQSMSAAIASAPSSSGGFSSGGGFSGGGFGGGGGGSW